MHHFDREDAYHHHTFIGCSLKMKYAIDGELGAKEEIMTKEGDNGCQELGTMQQGVMRKDLSISTMKFGRDNLSPARRHSS